MKRFFITALTGLVLSTNPVFANTVDSHVTIGSDLKVQCDTADIPHSINKAAHLAGLVRTDRDPRSWRTLWLVPGKERFFYYEWVLEDGSTVTKIETVKLKQAPDRRPLRESHPNVAILLPVIGATGSMSQSVFTVFHL